MDESETLLACPFCGNQHPELAETHKNHWRVGCAKCGSYNNNYLGQEPAIQAWNRRAGGLERSARDGKAVGCSAWLECARYHEARAREQHFLMEDVRRDKGAPKDSKRSLRAHMDKWRRKHLKWARLIRAHSNEKLRHGGENL